MEPGDKELVAKWLDDFEAKAKRMAGDSFGVAGVGRELEVIAALRRLLPSAWQPLPTAPRDKTRFVVWHNGALEVGWVERWPRGDFLFLDRWRDANGPIPMCQVDEEAAAAVLWTLPKPPQT